MHLRPGHTPWNPHPTKTGLSRANRMTSYSPRREFSLRLPGPASRTPYGTLS
ncbi:hypothetical protein K438DRAFT_1809318 [Mycena galopus ATCC 62051]|nr:hypothetical protein K438DRAFT_1809318 [Mycena galopus ATCC 62051]